MKKLFKCSVCNFVWEGETAPDICPKCGQPHEKFSESAQDNLRQDLQLRKNQRYPYGSHHLD